MRDDWQIERLAKRHDRSDFQSGEPLLDDWLKTQSGQYDRRDLARTYVSILPGDVRVLGYYALSNHRISLETLPVKESEQLPRIDIPAILLGRLAVDRTQQSAGLGKLLLLDALRRSVLIAEQVGVRAVEVHALNDSARRFYLKYGFLELSDDDRHLFLPMQVIRKLGLHG